MGNTDQCTDRAYDQHAGAYPREKEVNAILRVGFVVPYDTLFRGTRQDFASFWTMR